MKKFFVLIILAAIISSCAESGASPQIETPPYDGPTMDEVRAEFQSERAAWKRQGITHYRYTKLDYETEPYQSPIPHTVTVYFGNPRVTAWNGLPVSLINPGWAEQVQCEAKTIDWYFKHIEEHIGFWKDFENPLVIKYNKQYHYPEYFAGVYSDNTHWAILEITEFERLQ